ncbi:guanylate cyclase [Adlercreutzia sp. ZJ141]|uniref:guanylate cyclase n=1 Tax=Adlercreutzia sp. ZJ141 TaxID=2709406 RepID=UPI0013EE0D44|nr:guanylate cyclase [Adlercreutzia sp. ZJ141]
MFFVRLSRIVPLLIALALLAAIVYLVARAVTSPPRAKEILIRLFTWITLALSAVFGLFSLYALFEHNAPVLDLAASFLITALIGLAAIRIANHVFLKHNPGYRSKPMRANTKWRWPWQQR